MDRCCACGKCPAALPRPTCAFTISRRATLLVERAGTIPRGGFFCSADRRGVIESAFVLGF